MRWARSVEYIYHIYIMFGMSYYYVQGLSRMCAIHNITHIATIYLVGSSWLYSYSVADEVQKVLAWKCRCLHWICWNKGQNGELSFVWGTFTISDYFYLSKQYYNFGRIILLLTECYHYDCTLTAAFSMFQVSEHAVGEGFTMRALLAEVGQVEWCELLQFVVICLSRLSSFYISQSHIFLI